MDERTETALKSGPGGPKRNPAWIRNELILALDLYLRHRASPPSKMSNQVTELSAFLGKLASGRGGMDTETFRNTNSVYMKMMNFRRFDPEYTVDGKVGLVRGNKLEKVVWNEFYPDRPALIAAVNAIRTGVEDFRTLAGLLGENTDDVVANREETNAAATSLAALQKKYLNASPEVKERVSKYIERGSVGSRLKKERGFKCQVCEALGQQALGFKKTNGEYYVETHHVMPVAELEVGSLAVSNVMVVCANHHRQMHYGGVDVQVRETTFEFTLDNVPLKIDRFLGGDRQMGRGSNNPEPPE